MAQIDVYVCEGFCKNPGAIDELLDGASVDRLLAGITSGNERERQEFVKANIIGMGKLLTWLSHTIARDEADPGEKSNATLARLPMITFAMEQLCQLSYIANSSTEQVKTVFLESMLANEHILFHLIRRVFLGTANEKHMCVLANFSRHVVIVKKLAESILPRFPSFLSVVFRFLGQLSKSNSPRDTVTIYAGFLMNLSQSADVRKQIADDPSIIATLFEIYEGPEGSAAPKKETNEHLRSSCLYIVRNVVLDEHLHPKLFDKDNVGLIVHLMLPLTGPEKLPEKEMEELPLELQYLGENKRREAKVVHRRLLLESLLQMCATRHGREVLRETNVYYLLREYFNWELVPSLKLLLEDLIGILIKKEEEICVDNGPPIDNLKEVDVPEDVAAKLERLRLEELKGGSSDAVANANESSISEVKES